MNQLDSYHLSVLQAGAPQGISDNQERDVDLVGIAQDLVRFKLDRFPRGDDHLTAVESFLLVSILLVRYAYSLTRRSFGTMRMEVYDSR